MSGMWYNDIVDVVGSSEKAPMNQKKKVLLLIETSRSFGRQVIQGILRFTTERRNWSLFFGDRSAHEHFPGWLKLWDGDGIISRTGETKMYRQLQKLRIPVVEVLGDDRHHPPLVMSDERYNCRLVADHFWERRFRYFGFFSLGQNWWSLKRQRMFQEALSAYGMQCFVSPQAAIKNDIALSTPWWKGCEDEVFDWIRSLPKPIGIFCAWDMHALFLMNICESRGIAVPEDVSIVGYGNNADICRAASPSLSSVVPNAREIGYQAAILLDMMFMGKNLPDPPIYIPATHIEVRQSSDITAISDPDMKTALQFIRKNIEQKSMSVEYVARHLNLSKRTLVRRFHHHLGRSPNDEIVRVKMERAKELLRETSLSVGQIAVTLGYESTRNFGRAFLQHVGLTPSNYRRQFV